MQITIKTLKQESFKVEVEESDKVLTIKEKVEQLQGHPILADENPVSQYNITEKDFLVIMVTKAKPAAAPKAAAPAAASSTTATPAPAAAPAVPTPSAPVAQVPVEEAPVAAASAAPVVGENPTPAASAEPAAPTSADNALLTGTHFETAIQNMMEMGFPREQCMNAMRASFNNPDRAVEYLMTGIPEHLQAQTAAPAPVAAPRAPAAAAAPASTAATPATAAQPQNLFTAAAQAAANARRSAETGGAGGDGADSLAFLRDQPQFQQIREMVQANPELLQPLLVQLGQTNPHMLQLINQNQHAFLNLLNEGNEGDDGQPPAGSNHIYVTQEEQEAIQRLESLGFDRQTAVEAFLACDRDEQMAANYLFDHGHDDMEEDFQ
ncbi:UV excision repair protein RAD23 B [Mortierella sp. AD032]|nr:UV excision repair protein RAD23 B [Mortierella sp. AD032]